MLAEKPCNSLNSGELPDVDELKDRFVIKAGSMREVRVQAGDLSSYAPLSELTEEKGGNQ